MVAPKAAVKVDLPVRFLFGRVAVHFGIIKVLGEFELAEIEFRLQLVQVLPRPLHRREAEGCGDLREYRLLLVRRRILGKEGVELRLVPLPRLLERRAVAGREQQAQKSLKSRAMTCTQSLPPFIGLTAKTVSPKPWTKQKWMPSTPAQPKIEAPLGVQK